MPAHLRGFVGEGREQTFEQAAHSLHHADRRNRHEGFQLALLEHLQDIRNVPSVASVVWVA